MEDFFSLLFYQTQGSWEPLYGWETSKEYKTRAYNHDCGKPRLLSVTEPCSVLTFGSNPAIVKSLYGYETSKVHITLQNIIISRLRNTKAVF